MFNNQGWYQANDVEHTIPNKKREVDQMGLDLGQMNQLLDHIPYPIGTKDLVQFAKQHNANNQIVGMLERLPEKTFNSPDEIKNTVSSLGNLGNLGNLGGFKF
jgi:hypothetical protein